MSKIVTPLFVIEKVLGTFFILLTVLPIIPFLGAPLPLLVMFILYKLGLVSGVASISSSYVYISALAIIFILGSISLFFLTRNHNRAFTWVRLFFYVWVLFIYSGLYTNVSSDFLAEHRSDIKSFMLIAVVVAVAVLIYLYARSKRTRS